MNDATVTAEDGSSQQTIPTPDDPWLDDGFYYLYLFDPRPISRMRLTASKPELGYYDVLKRRRVLNHSARVVNFRLPPLVPGLTERASVAGDGSEGNSGSGIPSISADGRFVSFWSTASNLVPGDSNDVEDIFVRDRETGETGRVSVASDGSQGNGLSESSSLSADGRFVAFSSLATNLVPGDGNGDWDIFVHDRETGETGRVSVASDGGQGNGASRDLSLSADGRFVAFDSDADNLVPDDTNLEADIFVHDRQTGQTDRISVAGDGGQGNGSSLQPSISTDGRFVAFDSVADNLVPDDTNQGTDIFVHDRQTGQTSRVSVAGDGGQANGSSLQPSISADGRFVAFGSWADNLAAGPNNGETDIFVHDRESGETSRVSVPAEGSEGHGIGFCFSPAISADGRFVAFESEIGNLVPGDNNETADIFVHDRQTGETSRASLASDGSQANDHSQATAISANGGAVAFVSYATNLVTGDDNDDRDIFVHSPLPPQPSPVRPDPD